MKFFSSSFVAIFFIASFYVSTGFAEDIESCTNAAGVNACKSCCGRAYPSEKTTNPATGLVSSTPHQEYGTCTSECDRKFNDKDSQTRCDTAYDKYAEALDKSACRGEKDIAACEDKIDSCINARGGDDGSLDALAQLFNAKEGNEPATAQNFSCYNKLKTDDKKIEAAKKARADRLKELKKEIQDETKKQNDAAKDMAKDRVEIANEQRELNAKIKKMMRDADVSQREKTTKKNEDLQKSQEAIRNLNQSLVTTTSEIEKIKFNYQNTMLQYTDSKINSRCKSALTIAKSCLVQTAQGKTSSNPNCANFPPIPKTGSATQRTAELKRSLLEVRDACFEQENSSANKLRFENNEALKAKELQVKEKQEQINSENEHYKTIQTEFETIIKEVLKERDEEIQDINQQVADLSKKLDELVKQTNKMIADSKAITEDLQRQLNELAAGKLSEDLGLSDSGTIYEDIASAASGSLENMRIKTDAARSACCPEGKPEVNATYCSALKKFSPVRKVKSTGKTKTKAGT